VQEETTKLKVRSLVRGQILAVPDTAYGKESDGFMIIRKRKWVSVLLTIFLILASVDIAYAASAIAREQIGVQPCWSNTSFMVIDLSINGGKSCTLRSR
jgi:hypothetical protein